MTAAADSFVKLPKAVLSNPNLSSAAKLIYAYVADRVGNNGFAWPSVRRLALDCGVAVGTALKAIADLEAAGLLVVSRATGNPARHVNRYRLGASSLEALQPLKRSKNWSGSASKVEALSASETEAKLDPVKDPVLDPIKASPAKARPDPWKMACAAMTGDDLRTAEFQAAWESWTRYRRELHKKLTPSTIARQVRDLERMGHDDAITAIEQSICRGWTGLFPPRSGGNNGAAKPALPRLRENIVIPEYKL